MEVFNGDGLSVVGRVSGEGDGQRLEPPTRCKCAAFGRVLGDLRAYVGAGLGDDELVYWLGRFDAALEKDNREAQA